MTTESKNVSASATSDLVSLLKSLYQKLKTVSYPVKKVCEIIDDVKKISLCFY